MNSAKQTNQSNVRLEIAKVAQICFCQIGSRGRIIEMWLLESAMNLTRIQQFASLSQDCFVLIGENSAVVFSKDISTGSPHIW